MGSVDLNSAPVPSPSARRTVPVLLSALVIVLAALAGWHNSFSGAFVFDDVPTIRENLTIRHLWPPGEVLSPPADGSPVTGRPLVNLTLAVNYALSGTKPWSYHVFNLIIHLLAGLTLFGLVRRTLALSNVEGLRLRSGQALVAVGRGRRTPPQSPGMAAFGDAALQSDATFLALAIALLWTLHPLQTEAVTYVVQRTESLMGLFYLLTLYCFIRGATVETRPKPNNASSHREPGEAGRGDPAPTSGNPPGLLRRFAPRNDPLTGISTFWFLASLLACLLGMATKEVMVSAPLIVFLYDRTFVAGTFREAWRRHWRLHLALLATWLVLAWLVAGTGWSRGRTAGFGVGIAPGAYWLTQFKAVARYQWLSLWPHPLVADYGMTLVRSAGSVLPQALLLLLLAAGTAVSLWRRPALGFLGAWFFAILAPTSIVPVATQTMAEHRMYLPLAAVVALTVIGTHRLVGRRCLLAFLALAVSLGWLTLRRNEVYGSELSFWSDIMAKRPENARAYVNLGNISLAQGRVAEAIARYETALRLQPNLPETESNLSNALAQAGRPVDAVAHGEAALRLDPDSPNAHINLGNALMQLGRTAEAIAHYEAALRVQPEAADTRINLGAALVKAGRVDEAIAHYEAALRVEPDRAETEYALAGALMSRGDGPAALRHYTAAIRLKPDYIPARFALGNALAEAGRFAEAIADYQAIVRLNPRDVRARNNLGNALMMLGRLDEAIAAYEDALRLQPDNPSVRENLRLAHALREEAKRTP
jgi:tetratricopeptide (TPR) repeat protein